MPNILPDCQLRGLLLLQRSVLDLGVWLGNHDLSGFAVSRSLAGWRSMMRHSLTQFVRRWLKVNCPSTSRMWWLKKTLTQAISKRLALSHHISSHQQKQSEAPWHCLCPGDAVAQTLSHHIRDTISRFEPPLLLSPTKAVRGSMALLVPRTRRLKLRATTSVTQAISKRLALSHHTSSHEQKQVMQLTV